MPVPAPKEALAECVRHDSPKQPRKKKNAHLVVRIPQLSRDTRSGYCKVAADGGAMNHLLSRALPKLDLGRFKYRGNSNKNNNKERDPGDTLRRTGSKTIQKSRGLLSREDRLRKQSVFAKVFEEYHSPANFA